jgi:uncharacterized phage protein (TIGR01671 family)
MRTIKFRAWDEQNKIMHNDFQFIKSGDEGNDWIVFTSDKQTLQDSIHPFENPYFGQQLKIMEYTGLKDKNGKEIYEGDILETSDDSICYVVFEDTGFAVKSHGSEAIDWEFSNFYSECEIIGNIHQNPELLK